MTKIIFMILAAVTLAGCYETGWQANKREELENRLNDLERHQDGCNERG